MWNGQIDAVVEELFILIVPTSQVTYDAEKEAKAQLEAKRAELARVEKNKQLADLKSKHNPLLSFNYYQFVLDGMQIRPMLLFAAKRSREGGRLDDGEAHSENDQEHTRGDKQDTREVRGPGHLQGAPVLHRFHPAPIRPRELRQHLVHNWQPQGHVCHSTDFQSKRSFFTFFVVCFE